MDKLTFNGNYKKGKANGGAALTEALLLLLFKKIFKPCYISAQTIIIIREFGL